MRYTDQQRITKIYEYADKLSKYILDNNISREDVLTDFSLQWMITTPLYNIGEHAYNLSDEFKANNSDIPWPMISGLRHRLVHDYDGTNWNMIVEVIFEELPLLLNKLKRFV